MVARVVARISGWLQWPLALLARLTVDGALFFVLALFIALLSALTYAWSNTLLLLGLMLLSLWAVALWRGTRTLSHLALRRSCPDWVFAGDALPVTLTLSNAGAFPSAGVVVSEALEPESVESPGEGPARPAPRSAVLNGRTFAPVVRGRGTERLSYVLQPRRRGIFRFGATRLDSVAPLGFFLSTSTRACSGRLVVYPRLGEIHSSFFKNLETLMQNVRQSRPSRAEEDFRGLREYRRGDNPKWIHWRSSARTQRTLVKEFEEPQARRVLILLDTHLQRIGAQRFAQFEAAVSFAATLARDLLRRDCEIEFAALQPRGRLVHLAVTRQRRNLDALLEQLAGLRREERALLPELVDKLGRRALHNSVVLVLGLGSLAQVPSLQWLNTGDNTVRIVDLRSEDFRRIFRRTLSGGSAAARDIILDEELLSDFAGDDDTVGETLPAAG
jgi:uncharacterized protein (DUF58 family)